MFRYSIIDMHRILRLITNRDEFPIMLLSYSNLKIQSREMIGYVLGFPPKKLNEKIDN
jgi:hypothetical protein